MILIDELLRGREEVDFAIEQLLAELNRSSQGFDSPPWWSTCLKVGSTVNNKVEKDSEGSLARFLLHDIALHVL